MGLFESGFDRPALKGQLSAFAVWVAVTGFGVYLHPDPAGHGTHTQLGLPPCPSALLLHRPCPGCGLTTSFTATIHGHFAEAFHAHPLGPILYGLFTLFAIASLYGWVKKLKLNTASKGASRAITAFAILFFGFGVVRMLVVNNYTTDTDLQAAFHVVR
jgi:hypothetical protein